MTTMDERPRPELPAALRAVAYFTILCGIGTVLSVIVDLLHGRLNINLGVLLIPAGFGLLRLSQGWRTFALFTIWVGMIGSAIMFVLLAAGIGNPTMKGFTLFGPLGVRGAGLLISVVIFGVEFVQYRVLTRPDIRRLFGLTGPRAGPRGDRGTGSGPDGSASGPLPGS
jgi:hypothetical protein